MPTNNGSGWITGLRRLALYIRDGWRCMYCWRDLRGAPKREMTLDHLDTRRAVARLAALGLPQHPSTRLVMACRSCNSRRGDRMTWRAFVEWVCLNEGVDAAPRIRAIQATVRRLVPFDAARSLMAGECLDTDLEGDPDEADATAGAPAPGGVL